MNEVQRKTLDVLAGIRRAAEKCKHHKVFGKRIGDAIRAELPDYTVSVSKDRLFPDRWTIGVWGAGIGHNEGLRFTLASARDGKPLAWQEALEYELDRADPSDQIEFAAAEEKLVPALEKLNALVLDARKRARALTSNTPTPKSAKVRADRHNWDHASYELQARFPLLLKGDE